MVAKKTEIKPDKKQVVIAAPNFRTAEFRIRGTAPYCQSRFTKETQETLEKKHEQGDKPARGQTRNLPPKNFKKLYEAAIRKGPRGQFGIPAIAFKHAMVDSCPETTIAMTRAITTIFIEADFEDQEDGTPLVKITKGRPTMNKSMVKNATGVPDIRARPMWKPGWEAKVKVRFDADVLSEVDVGNLLLNAGIRIGVGEGRARPRVKNGKSSVGMDWGRFMVL